jgi:hypothetical protein
MIDRQEYDNDILFDSGGILPSTAADCHARSGC